MFLIFKKIMITISLQKLKQKFVRKSYDMMQNTDQTQPTVLEIKQWSVFLQ